VAVEVEGTNQVEEFLGILKRRAWWIAIPSVVLGALGIAVAVIVPKKYVASAQVLVRDDVSGLSQGSRAGAVSRLEGVVAPHVIRSHERATQILSNWEDYTAKPIAEQHEYRQKMLDNLDIDLFAVQNNAAAQIVRARFSHSNPQRALEFLSGVVNSWKSDVQRRFEQSERSKLETLEATVDQFVADQIATSKELETRRRLNHIRPDVIVFGREQSSLLASGEFGELDNVKKSIADDESALLDLEAQIAQWQEKFDAALPKRPGAPVVATGEVAAQIAELNRNRLELELEIDAKGWTVHAAARKKAEAEIESIVTKLESLRNIAASSSSSSEVDILNPERVTLSKQIEEAQGKKSILEARLARNIVRRGELEVATDRLFTEHQEIKLLQAQFDNLTLQIEEFETQRGLQASTVAEIGATPASSSRISSRPSSQRSTRRPTPM
jgi:capsular polysaccharide biosynthesis protein